ncbi:MFS transporter [Photobacterium sanctipauli]|uniref:MFS transporter n=1 Tax=Photobacterium sanctipauli TaxID=1342794 RepID=A0A2T3NYV1_9GAMM|nr:MFS transporter [Photobacterium sanctipauli]PSW21389.1 MFS transporter [Photobacterium sanctipauli]
MRQVRSLASFINSRLILITVLCALFASVLSALYTLVEFNFSVKPELLKKANAIAQIVHDDVELAVNAGIPFNEIRGMDAYLDDSLSKYPELTFVAVTAGDNLLYQAGVVSDLSTVDTLAFEQVSKQYLNASLLERISVAASQLPSIFSSPFTDSPPQSDVFRLPLEAAQAVNGSVYVGLSATYIQSQLIDIFFDIGIVLIAVLLVCFEVVMVVVMVYISGPLEESETILRRQINGDFSVDENTSVRGTIGLFSNRLNHDSRKLQNKFSQLFGSQGQAESASFKARLKEIAEKFRLQNKLEVRKGDIVDARIPLFVFSFGEELQKSFMPLYVAEFYEPTSWISKDVMLGLPISVFMFVIAAFTPFAAKWVERWGQKRLFLVGLIPAIAGYLGCAFATNSMDIVISRGVTAFGYAIITISCQSYIAAVVTAGNRAKGMSIFVGVLMTATMCGTALGGIIADRIGYQPVFLLSAVLAAFAGLLTWRMFTGELDTASNKQVKQKGGLMQLARNVKFVAIVVCCAIPAKIVLTGFLYFLVPLYLVSLDASQSEIGRIMMIYSLVIIPLSPIASGIADKTQKTRELIVLGTVLSGAILLSLYGEASLFKIILAVTLMGIAHSILKAPLIACALEASEATPEVSRTEVLGILRTAERIGSVLGPILVAALLAVGNYGMAMAIVGAGIIASGLLMLVFLNMPSTQRSKEAQA